MAVFAYTSAFSAFVWTTKRTFWLLKTNLAVPEDSAFISSKYCFNPCRHGWDIGVTVGQTVGQTDGFSALYSRIIWTHTLHYTMYITTYTQTHTYTYIHIILYKRWCIWSLNSGSDGLKSVQQFWNWLIVLTC